MHKHNLFQTISLSARCAYNVKIDKMLPRQWPNDDWLSTLQLCKIYMQTECSATEKKIIPEHDNIQVYLFRESKIQLNETKNNMV